MSRTGKPELRPVSSHYDANYGGFHTELYTQIRLEAFGEDIGQNSWLTAQEQDAFLEWLDLSGEKTLLDVACGSGGPALRLAASTGCSVVGIDLHEQAISNAKMMASQRQLEKRSEFLVVNAAEPLPFADASFDAITCVDAINHLPDRLLVIKEWARILKPGGRLVFTDPTTVTGPLTNGEIAVRSSIGFFLFVPRGYDESILAECGFTSLACKDLTANIAEIAEKRRAAREARSAALRQIEGEDACDAERNFLTMTARLAREGRLSRFVFASQKSS